MMQCIRHARFLLVPAFIVVLGCVGPKADLWPPPPDTPSQTIYVSIDTWHAVIALPHGDAPLTPDASDFDFARGDHALDELGRVEPVERSRLTDFEEWGYAERAWYLEGRQGGTGVLRALFWPTEGVVEVVQAEDLWAVRTADPPADLFEFRLSQAGFEVLRNHLKSTIANSEPIRTRGASRFYRASRSYHIFHHCHQYAAHALRQAGLPVSSIVSFTRTTFAWQLHRVVQRAGNDQVASHRLIGSKDQYKDRPGN